MERQNFEETLVKVKNLKPGNIITVFVPYEENTPDYYNGHPPENIREPYKDKLGRTGKKRPILVLKVTDDEITYVPITSKPDGY